MGQSLLGSGRLLERGLVAMTLVVAGLSLLSRRADVFVGTGGYGAIVTEGGLWLMRRPDVTRFEFYVTTPEPKLRWWPPAGYTLGFRGSRAIDVRLWAVVMFCAAAAGGAYSLRKRREAGRLERGLCVRCRYDRASLPVEARCPECGAAGRPANAHHARV